MEPARVPPKPLVTKRSSIHDPKKPESFEVMFSHGAEFGTQYQASTSRLHFTDPKTREWGPGSADRVHKTIYYGSKHIDRHVPATDPNPPTSLLEKKRAEWAASSQQTTPLATERWLTTNAALGQA